MTLTAFGNPDVKPEVGMGATYVGWSDRHPNTIVEVSKTGKSFTMQEDHIDYTTSVPTFTPNPDGILTKVRINSKGRWRVSPGGTGLVILNRRDYYRDPSF